MNINDIVLRPDYPAIVARFERFFSKRQRKGCWEWRGANVKGYGQFRVRAYSGPGSASYLGHRLAWVVYVGPIPEGLCVLHHCDNPPCVNPAHLFLGTMRVNSHDMFAKGREGMQLKSSRRLTLADVREIRERAFAGELRPVLAAQFGVSVGTVSDLTTGKTWRDAGGPTGSRKSVSLDNLSRWTEHRRSRKRRL